MLRSQKQEDPYSVVWAIGGREAATRAAKINRVTFTRNVEFCRMI